MFGDEVWIFEAGDQEAPVDEAKSLVVVPLVFDIFNCKLAVAVNSQHSPACMWRLTAFLVSMVCPPIFLYIIVYAQPYGRYETSALAISPAIATPH